MERKERTEREMRLLRACGSSVLEQIAFGSATQGL